MPTLSTFPDLLAAVSPYLTSPQPIAAMQADGFTFDGEVGAALARRMPAKPLTRAVLQRLEQTFGPPLPTRLHVGRLPSHPPTPPPASGFSGVAAIRLDAVNPVLAELWNVGTLPRQLTASLTADIIDLPTLRQLCSNVPTASDASLGLLQIASPPVLSASSNNGNIHVDVEFELPVLGAQPASFKGAVHIEIPLGLDNYVSPQGLRRLRLALDTSGTQGAVTTLQVAADSVIVPNSSASQSKIESTLSTGIQDALLYFSVNGTFSIPAQIKLTSFPNTTLALLQQGAVTISRDNQSFVILGFNVSPQQTVEVSALVGANTPVSPFDTHLGLAEACGNDILNAFIRSGDLGGFVSRFVARHTDNLGPRIDCTGGSVTFENGNVTVNADFVAHDLCRGLDVNFSIQASGPPIISNGYMSIGAQYLDVSVDGWDEFLCYLVSSFVPLGAILLTVVLIALSGGHDAPVKSINVSLAVTPLPGSEMDWSIVMKQATATDGTLALDGAAALTTDERMFVYLRIEEPGLFPLGPTPLTGAQVTLFELDDPAPPGDDVVIPHTGTTITATPKFTIVTSSSYQPTPDQTIGTLTTDDSGDVLFIINTATSGGTPALNNVGGIVTTSQSQTDNYTGKMISSTTTHSYVLEGEPDFGVTITDASGMVRATRQLIARNASGNRVGSKDSPVIVEVPRVIVINRVNAG
jgi:hypothetical protein